MQESWETLISTFQSMPPFLLVGALFAVGVLFLLFGWHVYRIALIALSVLVGGGVGAGLAYLVGIPMIILALPLGLLVGLVSVRLERVGAFLMGGLCSALWILSTSTLSGPGVGLYIAAAGAFIVTGILAALAWRPMVIVGLAVIGSWFLTYAVLLGADTFSPGTLDRMIGRHAHWILLLGALLTIIGIGFQYREEGGEGREQPQE